MAFWDSSARFDEVFFDEPVPGAAPRKHMKKIKMGLSKLNPTATTQFGYGIVESMTGNIHVPTPDPALSVITADADAVQDKQAEIEAKLTELDTLRTQLGTLTGVLKDDLRKLAANVEDKCDGNEEKLRSTGFSLAGDPTPRGPLDQVQNLRVAVTDNEGQLEVRYKSVPGAASYVIDTATDPDGPWTHYIVITRITQVLTGLIPGTKYWVRVRAVGTNGFGPWSDPACKIAA